MGTPYTGNPATPPQGKLVLTEPVDGDGDSAATFNVPYSQGADFSEMLYEQQQAIVASAWFKQTSGVAGILYGVAATQVNNTTLPVFIAVGVGAAPPTILTSPDAVTWTSRTAVGTSTTAFAVGIKDNGGFAVVLANGASGQNVMTSTDGTTWTLRTSSITLAAQLGGVAWSQSLGLWAIVGGAGGASAVATSSDGITWTARTLGGASDQMVSVTWSPSLGLFIACGYNTGTNAAEVYTSADGTTWTSRTVPSAQTNKSACVSWAPAASLAMMVSATGGFVWTSPDGINWTAKGAVQSTTAVGIGNCLVHTGRQWLVFGGGNYVCSSSIDNGTTWVGRREQGSGNPVFWSAAKAHAGLLVTAGGSGTILTGLTTQLT